MLHSSEVSEVKLGNFSNNHCLCFGWCCVVVQLAGSEVRRVRRGSLNLTFVKPAAVRMPLIIHHSIEGFTWKQSGSRMDLGY